MRTFHSFLFSINTIVLIQRVPHPSLLVSVSLTPPLPILIQRVPHPSLVERVSLTLLLPILITYNVSLTLTFVTRVSVPHPHSEHFPLLRLEPHLHPTSTVSLTPPYIDCVSNPTPFFRHGSTRHFVTCTRLSPSHKPSSSATPDDVSMT